MAGVVQRTLLKLSVGKEHCWLSFDVRLEAMVANELNDVPAALETTDCAAAASLLATNRC